MAAAGVLAKPVRGLGSFCALSLDILMEAVRPPFAWSEFLAQVSFIARVSVAPAMLLTIPFSLIVVVHFGILLNEIGAADLSGAGVGYSTVTQTGPIVTVFVVAGAAATAVCADLGARTIRDEIDAMKVMGIDPVRALLVPRVAALTLGATLLNAIVCSVGMIASYFFAIFIQGVTPGAFAGSLTLLTGLSDTAVSFAKAALFGLAAGLIACYKGTTPSGGPQAVGNAVNETVVFSFMALMFLLVVMDVFGEQVKL
ncbi:MlaE family ABC transporter permease [Mycobacterium paraintracellulare]|uniref:MlaE family ABC transporter permease n=1 Tax=Mycobacterium paraintracellulare TaxID=1138383 RepID=UPI001925B4C2|nr:ABC transporter permease [Mycobacterium paraintracellulare]BCP14232.1 ABC transporter permease [Mycobacterium paraintracellulare]